MTTTVLTLSPSELARRAQTLYDEKIRALVETEDNIGKMVIIDVESGDYQVGDAQGQDAAAALHARRQAARLYGLRIGYNVAYSLGGLQERTTP